MKLNWTFIYVFFLFYIFNIGFVFLLFWLFPKDFDMFLGRAILYGVIFAFTIAMGSVFLHYQTRIKQIKILSTLCSVFFLVLSVIIFPYREVKPITILTDMVLIRDSDVNYNDMILPFNDEKNYVKAIRARNRFLHEKNSTKYYSVIYWKNAKSPSHEPVDKQILYFERDELYSTSNVLSIKRIEANSYEVSYEPSKKTFIFNLAENKIETSDSTVKISYNKKNDEYELFFSNGDYLSIVLYSKSRIETEDYYRYGIYQIYDFLLGSNSSLKTNENNFLSQILISKTREIVKNNFAIRKKRNTLAICTLRMTKQPCLSYVC